MILEGLLLAHVALVRQPAATVGRARYYYSRERLLKRKQKDAAILDVGPRVVRTLVVYTGPSFDQRWSWLPVEWQEPKWEHEK